MVKGCQRRMVVVKDTGSPLFEEAYLILREGAADAESHGGVSMAEEAKRLVSEELCAVRGEKRRAQKLRWFFLGAVVSAVLTTLFFAAVYCT